jgi:hypothetical protein
MKYYFVIDTDTYAGNFEREITTYITGIVGDCGRDQMIQKYVLPLIPQNRKDEFDRIIRQEPDDHGCFRPCKIYHTPEWHNNGLGFHFKDGQEKQALKEYIKTVKQDISHMYSKEEAKEEIKNIKKKGITKYPAYNSVAICLFDKPNNNLIKYMKERAEEYAKICRENRASEIGGYERSSSFNITGFRLITEKTVSKEIKI